MAKNLTFARLAQGMLLACCGLGVSSCKTSVNLNSSPPGSIVKAEDKVLGQTPLNLTAESLPKTMAGGYLLRVEREGYKLVWIWVPDGIRGLDFVLNMTPFEIKDTEIAAMMEQSISREDLYRLTAKLLRAQSSILLDKKESAEMQDVYKDYSDIGSVHFLSALEALQKGDKNKAVAELNDAVILSPKEADFLALKNELQKDGKTDKAPSDNSDSGKTK